MPQRVSEQMILDAIELDDSLVDLKEMIKIIVLLQMSGQKLSKKSSTSFIHTKFTY